MDKDPRIVKHPGEALDPDEIREDLAMGGTRIVREPRPAYFKAILPVTKLTIAEYLEWEKDAYVKHEYYQGEVFAMAGAKVAHNKVCSNLFLVLGMRLKGRPLPALYQRHADPYPFQYLIHLP